MVSISTAALTAWESPEAIESAASQLQSNADSFATTVEQADSTWATLPSAYQGPSQNEFYHATIPAARSASSVREAGSSAYDALSEFATELITLKQQRNQLISDIGAFEQQHSGSSEDDLEFGETEERSSLQSQVSTLQQRYEDLVSTCTGILGRLSGSDGAAGGGGWRPDLVGAGLDYGVPLVTQAGAGFDGPSVSREYRRINSHTTFANGTQRWDTFTPKPTVTQTSWSWFGVPLNGMSRSALWEAAKSDVTPGATVMDRLKNGFGRSFVGNLPVGADIQAWQESKNGTYARNGLTSPSTSQPVPTTRADGSTVTSQTTTQTRTSGLDMRGGLNRAMRGAGTAGTVAAAGLQFKGEREANIEQLASENPDMTNDEIKAEATHDAAANTAGRTATTVLASAGVGAAVGTAIPIPVVGTAAGFVAGLGTGVVMELDFLPDVTGDGQKDSIGDAVGHWAEGGWDYLRHDAGDDLSNAWDGAKDLADDAGDWVSESNANPANWF